MACSPVRQIEEEYASYATTASVCPSSESPDVRKSTDPQYRTEYRKQYHINLHVCEYPVLPVPKRGSLAA